ncbi:hypothetical protein B0T20DRAFT_409230 [Sordaria brevicollis]|uniref:non-specific serine/threonine protein kinase n=1 Tax=Sordaria brevicollis TaxID=83679 RepID=A0AAE0PFM2_SORBR|nr:hypothetical protein B0T20DRAFT_409230 [Sordaria brevicollis]
MSRLGTKTKVRKYGKPTTKSRAELLFAELPKTPVKQPRRQSTHQILEPEPLRISEPEITESHPAYSHEQKKVIPPSPEAEPEPALPGPEPMSDEEDDVHDVTEQFDSILLDEDDDHHDAPYASTPRPSIGSYTSYNTSVPSQQQHRQRSSLPHTRSSLSSQPPPRLSPFRKLASPLPKRRSPAPQKIITPTRLRSSPSATKTKSPFGRPCLSPHQQQHQHPFPLKSPRVQQLIQQESHNSPRYQQHDDDQEQQEYSFYDTSSFHTLSWADICGPPSSTNTITKIAEASYAEVYRITNPRGTSIIKVIRLQSPIKPQTKAQVKSGLVDEEPHAESDLQGELKISEWLAAIPGFVIYKERFIVEGKGTKELLETHQVFQRKMKRKDPGRAQFYPSPSRYLDETRFLVVELGDAGTALEDSMTDLKTREMLWDVFLSTAVALARAEGMVRFEHRDLHEGNLCVRRVRPARVKKSDTKGDASCTREGEEEGEKVKFGWSGLEVTILDYGLSRATDPDTIEPDFESESYPASPIGQKSTTEGRSAKEEAVVFYDLEKDPSMFTSTHAPQCEIYRLMRAHLLSNTLERKQVSWAGYYPYTNVLWLSYIYGYLCQHFKGDKRDLKAWREETEEMWKYMDPGQVDAVRQEESIGFGAAGDVVVFAIEKGWITEEQVMDVGDRSTVLFEESVLEVPPVEDLKSGGDGVLSQSIENHQSVERSGPRDEDDEEDDQIRRHSKRRRTKKRYVEDADD